MSPNNSKSTLVYPVLLAGVLAVSASPILIRFAFGESLPTLLIAASRLSISALILTLPTLRRYRADLARLKRSDLLLIGTSGLLLALHFVLWITSLTYTSVLISTVLVTTSPLWVALFEVVFLRAHLRRGVIVGLVIAFVGGIVIGVVGGGSGTPGSAPLLGGALALAGAVAFACYLVIGRSVRDKLPLLPYIWMVYGFGGLLLLVVIAFTGVPITGYSSNAYLLILLIALIPQLIGHSSFNYAVRFVSATYVGIATQMEPLGSAIAAFFLFQEAPLPPQIVGSAAILVGVIIATIAQERANSQVEVEAAEDTL